jgi:hypothetical protein
MPAEPGSTARFRIREQIKARMDDRFGLLTAGDRSAAPRQQTLRATIEWSHELLDPAERVLFRRLSVFAGWSLEMAEQVCADDEIPAGDVLGLLAALVDKSLVGTEPAVLGQVRYRMLDTIRNTRPSAWPRPARPARSSTGCATTACGPRSITGPSGWRGSRPPGRTGWTPCAGTTSRRAT